MASLAEVFRPAYEKSQVSRCHMGMANGMALGSPDFASCSSAAPPLGRGSSCSNRATLSYASPGATTGGGERGNVWATLDQPRDLQRV